MDRATLQLFQAFEEMIRRQSAVVDALRVIIELQERRMDALELAIRLQYPAPPPEARTH
jgi:hypothetical protein